MGIKLKFGKDKKPQEQPETDIIDTLDEEIEGRGQPTEQEQPQLISTDMAMLNILGELSEDIKKLLRYNEKRMRALEELHHD